MGSVQEGKKALIFPQVRAALTASIGNFICGNINGWSGAALPKLNLDFEMGTTESSLVASLIGYGALLGSLLSGKFMDSIGRKKLMMIVAPFTAFGWILIGISTNLYLIYLGRFVSGFASGFLFTSCPVYTNETCQSSLRGRLGSLPTLNMTIGIVASYIFSGLFSWRVSTYICAVPAFVFLVALYFTPESPYWYLLKGNQKAATESLLILRGPDFDVNLEIKEIMMKLSDTGTETSYMELLNRRTLIPLLIALFIQTLQQLCGGNIIMVYTATIFESAKSSVDIQMATIITGFMQILGTVISIFIIDKYGRKILLSSSVALNGVFMGLLGGYYFTLSSDKPWAPWSPIVIISFMLVSYCLGCRSIPWIIGSEVFNTSIRSRANSVVVFYNRVLNLIIIQMYPYMLQDFGNANIFFMYSIFGLIFGVCTLFIVPETKGKSMEEIQEYFENKIVITNAA